MYTHTHTHTHTHTQNLQENYKTLMAEIKAREKWSDISSSWTGRRSTVKTSVLPYLI